MIFINLDIDNILENTKEKIDNGIQNFCNELSSFLNNTDNKNTVAENVLDSLKTFNNSINDKYYYIVSGDEFFSVQTYENGKWMSSGTMHKSEFPINTEIGTALRWKNGEFIIDKQLTEKLAKQEKEIDLSIENLYNSFRTEGTYYKAETIRFGTILREKDGKFIVDEELTEKSLEKIIELEKSISKKILYK